MSMKGSHGTDDSLGYEGMGERQEGEAVGGDAATAADDVTSRGADKQSLCLQERRFLGQSLSLSSAATEGEQKAKERRGRRREMERDLW